MLINLEVENWRSYKESVSFSMLATRESQHGQRLTKLGKYRSRALPAAALYGGNASGKTNLFKALDFARQFISRGTLPGGAINIEPFLLDEQSRKDPVRFLLEILIDTEIYQLSFKLTSSEVLEEKLVHILSTSEKVLYHRTQGDPDPKLHSSIANQRLKFAFEGTRENQLFLTNAVSQKLEVFLPVYLWFAQKLVLVAPDSRFESFEQYISNESPLSEGVNSILLDLDTGISQIKGEEISFENLLLPEALKQQIRQALVNNSTIKINDKDDKILITREDEKLIVKKLYTYHKDIQGKEQCFEMNLESDGSKRIIDLLPAFLELSRKGSDRIYIIDEIERSLHSLLIRQLLETFLSSCDENSRKQLLFTTHDLLLMDQNLLRRDEMWITERKPDGSSSIISFSEYEDVRNDKNILKSYLQGRMGGVPHIYTGNIPEVVMSHGVKG